MTVLVKREVADGIIFAFLEDADDSNIKFFLGSLAEGLITVPGVYERWWEFVKETAIVILADSNGMTEDEVRGKFEVTEVTAAERLH